MENQENPCYGSIGLVEGPGLEGFQKPGDLGCIIPSKSAAETLKKSQKTEQKDKVKSSQEFLSQAE